MDNVFVWAVVFGCFAVAILGLWAMYFLLADLMHRFVHLKLGLALVLVWVGVKMLLTLALVEPRWPRRTRTGPPQR